MPNQSGGSTLPLFRSITAWALVLALHVSDVSLALPLTGVLSLRGGSPRPGDLQHDILNRASRPAKGCCSFDCISRRHTVMTKQSSMDEPLDS